MKKNYDDQAQINEKMSGYKDNREMIKGSNSTVYSTVDMLITMEHLYQLINDIFNTKELRQYFKKDHYETLNNTKKVTEKWKYVRNKLGGHIDLESVENFCKKYNFKGVFLSEDLECDVAALNMMLIESAVNSSRASRDIFGRDLDFKNNLVDEVKIFIEQLNKDWNEAFTYFEVITKLMYEYGKPEKLKSMESNVPYGIVITTNIQPDLLGHG